MTGVTDRAVSVGCVVAYTLWAVSSFLLVTGVLIWDDRASDHLVRFSLWVMGAAVTATVRVYFVAQNRIIRNAFALHQEQHAGGDELSIVR